MKTSGDMEGTEPAGLYLYLGISKTTFKALLRRSEILFGHVSTDLPSGSTGRIAESLWAHFSAFHCKY
jgi:hypothetical protein